jgi:hypothetical protein
MKVLGLLDSVEEDEETGEMDEVSANTVYITLYITLYINLL